MHPCEKLFDKKKNNDLEKYFNFVPATSNVDGYYVIYIIIGKTIQYYCGIDKNNKIYRTKVKEKAKIFKFINDALIELREINKISIAYYHIANMNEDINKIRLFSSDGQSNSLIMRRSQVQVLKEPQIMREVDKKAKLISDYFGLDAADKLYNSADIWKLFFMIQEKQQLSVKFSFFVNANNITVWMIDTKEIAAIGETPEIAAWEFIAEYISSNK